MSRVPGFPTREAALDLHVRMLADDIAAPGDVCAAYCEPLIAHLRRRHPKADDDLLQTATHSALVAYVKDPDIFDLDRCADLGTYLRLSANGDLLNLLARERRHQRKKISVAPIELDAVVGNQEERGDGPVLRLVREESLDEARRIVESVAGDCDEVDRAVLRLLESGQKATAAYASVLNVAHLPPTEQALVVKRAKDRVKARLKRGFKDHA